MVIKIIISIISSILSSIAYRAGGMSKEEKHWIPRFMRKSWVRDWLCPACGLGVLLAWWQPNSALGWIMILPYYVLSGLALSTYWDWLFGYDSFYLHGFMAGLAAFPLCWAGLHWWTILVNAIISGGLMGWLSVRTGNVNKEEYGRGAIFAITKLLLLI